MLEIIVEELRFIGEHGKRDVRAHGACRFHSVPGHRENQFAEILEGVAECELLLKHRVGIGFPDLGCALDVGKLDEVFIEPLPVRLPGGNLPLDFLIVDNATLRHVHEEHASGLQPSLAGNAFGFDGKDTGFGSHDDIIILGHIVA